MNEKSGWNRSGGSKTKVAPKKPSAMRGVLAGLVIVAAIGGALFWLFNSDQTPKVEKKVPKKDKVIREVTPAVAPKPVEVKPTTAQMLRARYPELKIPDDWEKPYPPQAYWPDGRLKQHSRYVKVITNKVSRASMSVEELTFKNFAERDIAGMLLVDPGEVLIGEMKYDESFTEHFLESLKTEIVDSDEDTPFQKELKQAVREAKKEMKARYDAGESLPELMNETRTQLQELGLYREEIKKMVNDAKEQHEEFTAQDEKDLIDAANKMLEDRGCKPLKIPSLLLEQIALDNGKGNDDASASEAAPTDQPEQ